MRVGISTASLFMRLECEDALPLFAEWGVDCAEVFLTSFCEYHPVFAYKLARRKGSVEAYSLHVLNTQYEPQLFAAHPRVKKDAYYWLDKTMTCAQILGARYYTFHGLARIKRTFREDVPRVAEETEKIAAFCKRYGVQLSVENVEWAFYNRPGIFRELKAACPALCGTLDVKQARLSGYDYREYLAEMGESLSHVHASDIGADGRMCLPGRGTTDFDELFARLADVGFDGAVLIEAYGGDYGAPEELLRAYRFLAEKAEKYSLPAKKRENPPEKN